MQRLSTALVIGATLFGGAISSKALERPNIILFLIDDQDTESIGAFGGKTYTPNLDRMASQGVRFPRAYVSSAAPAGFQPMKANFGLLPSLEAPVRNKRDRYAAYSHRALADLRRFVEEQGLELLATE